MDFANYFEMGFAFQMTGQVIMRFKISVTSHTLRQYPLRLTTAFVAF
jgi:hypothetical protein